MDGEERKGRKGKEGKEKKGRKERKKRGGRKGKGSQLSSAAVNTCGVFATRMADHCVPRGTAYITAGHCVPTGDPGVQGIGDVATLGRGSKRS